LERITSRAALASSSVKDGQGENFVFNILKTLKFLIQIHQTQCSVCTSRPAIDTPKPKRCQPKTTNTQPKPPSNSKKGSGINHATDGHLEKPVIPA
jgi:hypothetical protein